jgi:hypothetical protein
MPKYSPQHPILKHPQPTFLPQCQRYHRTITAHKYAPIHRDFQMKIIRLLLREEKWNMSYLTTLLANKILVSGIDGRIVTRQKTWLSASCFSWYFSESYISHLGGNESVTGQFADENLIQILFTKPEEKMSLERKFDLLHSKCFRK